jgi:hypothetical protein
MAGGVSGVWISARAGGSGAFGVVSVIFAIVALAGTGESSAASDSTQRQF